MNDILLWIEDDPNDVLLVGRAMAKVKLGPPIIARDGEEGVAYLSGKGEYADRSRHPLPTLILLDLKLPKVSGLELLKWLRQQPLLKRIPVLVFTSSRETTDINRAYELGANAFLVKPVDFGELNMLLLEIRDFWCGVNRGPVLQPPSELSGLGG